MELANRIVRRFLAARKSPPISKADLPNAAAEYFFEVTQDQCADAEDTFRSKVEGYLSAITGARSKTELDGTTSGGFWGDNSIGWSCNVTSAKVQLLFEIACPMVQLPGDMVELLAPIMTLTATVQGEVIYKKRIIRIDFINQDVLDLIKSQVLSQVLSLDNIAAFLKPRTYFERGVNPPESCLEYASRQHGDIGRERFGREDLAHAKGLVRLLKEKYGTGIRTEVDTIDEWVNLTIWIP